MLLILIFCSVILVISWAILWWFHTEVIHFTLLNSAVFALILKKACLSFVCRWSSFWCSSEASFVLSSLVSDRAVWSCEYNGWRFIAMCKTFNPLYSLIIIACDWFKKVLFSTNLLAKLLYRTGCYWTVCYWTVCYRTCLLYTSPSPRDA